MEPKTRVESFNNAIRGFITSALTLVFCYLALIEKVSSEVFTSAFITVLVWWFASRDKDKATEAAARTNGASPSPTGPTP